MESQQTEVAALYSAGAVAYREHWAPLLLGASRHLVDRIAAQRPSAVLEIAAGVGALLPLIASAAHDAVVVGIDLTPEMIGLAPPEFGRVVGDVVTLPFADESFDSVVMAFALFHVIEPGQALAEMRRVLRPDGQIQLATWLTADSKCGADLVWFEELSREEIVDPELPSSRDLVNTPDKLTELLDRSGFSDIITETRVVVDPMNLDEYLERRTQLGWAAQALVEIPRAERDSCLARVRDRLQALSSDDLVSRETAILAWARKAD